jgi:hypothetical protein
MPINGVAPVHSISAGEASGRMSNIADGMEFKTASELKAFVRSCGNQIRLRAGKSFMVYLEKSGPSPYGSHQQQIEGFNKKSPYSAKVVLGKLSGSRMPGVWLEITASAKAKAGAKDQLKVVEQETIMCKPPTSKALFAMTITVV